MTNIPPPPPMFLWNKALFYKKITKNTQLLRLFTGEINEILYIYSHSFYNR